MKTDKFEESIRRKLESIDPPYRERDWTLLQSFLRGRGVASTWPNPVRWMVPAAAAASIVGLLVSTVWLYRSNQQKDQTIADFRKAAAVRPSATPTEPERDTVYVTRYVDRKTGESIDGLAERLQSDRLVQTDRERGGSERVTPENRTEASSQTSGGAGRTSSEGRLERLAPSRRRNEPDAFARATPRPESASSDRLTGNRSGATRQPVPVSERLSPDRKRPVEDVRSSSSGTSGPAPGSETASRSLTVPLTPLMGRSVQFDTAYFVERYERRSRRIRPAVVPYAGQQPVIEEPESGGSFRLGVTGEAGIGQRAIGLVGEVLIARRFALSVGLNSSVLPGEEFLTDQQFFQKTKREFRKYYAPGVPPQYDISNIDRRSINLVVPVSLGYRMPLGDGFTLVPAVGANLSLRSRERVTFTYRRGPGDINQSLFELRQPTVWYHHWTLSMAAEKRWGNWVLQAGPYFTLPFQTAPNGFNTATAGLRARVLYAF